MDSSIRKNAEIEIDSKTRAYMQRHGDDYRTALIAVTRNNPELAHRYAFGGDAVVTKNYDADTLTPAQQAMANLLADAGKTKTLAGWALDRLAKRRIENIGQGIADPVDAYRRALSDARKENLSLARAAQDGYIDDTDFELLAFLIPAIAGEVERKNFSHDSTRCRCGQNTIACKAKKLAAQRKVHEDNLVEYRQCILDAAHHGNRLDAMRCIY